MKVSDHDRATFATTGLLNLKRCIPKSKTEPAREVINQELARMRLRENGKWHLKKFEGVSPFRAANKIAQGLTHQPQFEQVIPPDLVTYLTDLAGFKPSTSHAHPQILVTPPQKEEWSIPTLGWHVDVARPSTDIIPGIQIFVLLDDIAPRGGATMAIAGSHLDPDALPTPERVVEMSGKAGDVYLMDMRVRHAPSINATKQARMMLTSRFLRP